MDEHFIHEQEKLLRDRLTQYRLRKGVSESRMSLDLGKSRSYIRGITSGSSFPGMDSFFEICEYLSVYPEDFFHVETQSMRKELLDIFERLSDEDKGLVIQLAKSLADKKPE